MVANTDQIGSFQNVGPTNRIDATCVLEAIEILGPTLDLLNQTWGCRVQATLMPARANLGATGPDGSDNQQEKQTGLMISK